jgi:hypothetical protein
VSGQGPVAYLPPAQPRRPHRNMARLRLPYTLCARHWSCRGYGLGGGDPISHLRDLLGDLVDFFTLLCDHMLLNLADIGVDLT